ncbi:MAG TPA: transglutaminase-like domain-containing protein [Bryobacteraceae bacterium]|nr:transglutaminase-like domain-containing protein [Bryobacteraceae bacterium]
MSIASNSRRDFLRGAAAFSGAFLSGSLAAEPAWRTFEVTTRIEVLQPSGITRVWAPAALLERMPFQRTLTNSFQCAGGSAKMVQSKADGLGIVTAEFPAGVKPLLTVRSRVATRNWAVDLSEPGKRQPAGRAELSYWLRPTKLLPTDGIVKDTALRITTGMRTDADKARAIYEWIVENTYRDPKTRGCGLGDIRFMLRSGDLGGKCADLNALFVGLARAAGLPARDVYGIRVARSQMGYKSLGASSENVTHAQHCRAEVYLDDYGWVAVDPADVRKVALEEPPGNRPLNDAMVEKARVRLFGSWEMNWIAYNFAHDVALPESKGPRLPFLMYPQAETSAGRLDSLDADHFRYEITAEEIPAGRLL